MMKLIALISAGVLACLAMIGWRDEPAMPYNDPAVAGVASPTSQTGRPPNEIRLRECSEELMRGRQWLLTIPAYTATFRKQERLGNELHDEDAIQLKLRHQPFSVMMRWVDEGRVVFYREGTNENRLTVKMGGWKGRLGWINLDPNSSLAMAESRYPVTDAGLLGLIDELLRQWEPFNDRQEGVHCEWLEDEDVGGRRCRVFHVTYASPEVFREYRQSTVWLDAEHPVPLRVLNYDWFREDSANPDGLVEHYVYEDVDFHAQLADADFRAPHVRGATSQVALTDEDE